MAVSLCALSAILSQLGQVVYAAEAGADYSKTGPFRKLGGKGENYKKGFFTRSSSDSCAPGQSLQEGLNEDVVVHTQ